MHFQSPTNCSMHRLFLEPELRRGTHRVSPAVFEVEGARRVQKLHRQSADATFSNVSAKVLVLLTDNANACSDSRSGRLRRRDHPVFLLLTRRRRDVERRRLLWRISHTSYCCKRTPARRRDHRRNLLACRRERRRPVDKRRAWVNCRVPHQRLHSSFYLRRARRVSGPGRPGDPEWWGLIPHIKRSATSCRRSVRMPLAGPLPRRYRGRRAQGYG